MHVYRICRAAYGALDGEGARLYGGRWNSPSRPVVYTSASLALAALEYLVHLDPDLAPSDLVALTIDVPDALTVEALDVARLPAGWSAVPEHPACAGAGDAWATAAASVGLRVPAASIPEEQGVLNPRHPDMARVAVVRRRAFSYDPRLLR